MNSKKFLSLAILGTALSVPVLAASAQQGPDSSLDSNYGTYNLSEGFMPDPYVISMIGGGGTQGVNASVADATCAGVVTAQPDLVINYTTSPQFSTDFFRVFYASLGDATLVIEQPDGTFICNDDFAGTDPVIDIVNPLDGEYSIWVGAFGTEYVYGYLMFTEFEESIPGNIVSSIPSFGHVEIGVNFSDSSGNSTGSTTGNTGTTGQTASTGSLDPSAEPNYTVDGGALVGTASYDIQAGGNVDVFSANLGASCRGYVTTNPDFILDWAGGDLNIFTRGNADTTLVVYDGSTFHCNDDSAAGTLNGQVVLPSAPAGEYAVWIGTFSSGTLADTNFNVSDNANDTP